MSAEPQPEPLIHSALKYGQAGLKVFPLKADKTPLIVRYHQTASTDPHQIEHWWQQWPNALIGHTLDPRIIILDVDPRHLGHLTWDALGPDIDALRRHHSGRNDGGTHHWYLRPDGKLSIARLNEWAEQHQVGQPITDPQGEQIGWSAGIDLITHNHRYTILPPSIHPETGQPYWWNTTAEPGPLPDHITELLQAPPPPPPRPKRPQTDSQSDSPADWYTDNHTWNDVLEPNGWTIIRNNGHDDGSLWAHPNATAACSASIKHGILFVYSDRTPFQTTRPGDPHGYTRFAAYAQLEYRGDQSEATKHCRQQMNGTTPPNVDPETGEISTPYNLPHTFWETRPTLQHIRQAAHNRLVSADALLISSLARVVTQTSHRIVLPATVGSRASINLFASIVDPSGGGKTAAVQVARELIPLERTDIADPILPSSGEGLIEAFFAYVPEEQPDGKTKKVKRQVKQAGFAIVDEGQSLLAQADRTGSTIMETIRSAWIGGDLGQHNAAEERKRWLKAHQYRLCIVIGFQMAYAAHLIGDGEGGTPQRFTFALATDPNIDPEADWPGQLKIPSHHTTPHFNDIELDDTIRTGIRQRRLQRSTGELKVDPLDTHADLRRLKLAAALALLEGRLNIDLDDWDLAGIIDRTSCAVRTLAIETDRAATTAARQSATAIAIEREAATETAAITRTIHRCARTVARKIWKEGTMSAAEAYRSVSSRYRPEAPLDAVIDVAVAAEWVHIDQENTLTKGTKRP